jgi:tetratricopeptide (TPR) repeat protein
MRRDEDFRRRRRCLPAPDPRRVAAFADGARRYERERSDALVQVDLILGETRRENVAALVERAELRTCGALQHLSEIIETELARDAPYAEALAGLALAVAAVLPPGYPRITVCQLHARAWRNLGEARSALARYEEALEAFASAECELEAVGGLEHDRAIIRMSLALTLRKLGRAEEARALLRECEQTFREFGDDARADIARDHLAVAGDRRPYEVRE